MWLLWRETKRSQILSGVVQGADLFTSVFSDKCDTGIRSHTRPQVELIYEFHLRSGMRLNHSRYSMQGDSLRVHLFIMIGEILRSAL